MLYTVIYLLNFRFKIWHYTGSLVYQRPWNNQEELWEVIWQNFPSNCFSQKPISYKAVDGIINNPIQSQGNIFCRYFYCYNIFNQNCL